MSKILEMACDSSVKYFGCPEWAFTTEEILDFANKIINECAKASDDPIAREKILNHFKQD